MRKVITEQDFDDEGNMVREVVTVNGEIVRQITISYQVDSVANGTNGLRAVPNE